MKNLTDSAQNHLDKYLSRVRASLQTCTSVDAEEVERDITEHIETELESAAERIASDSLDAVVKRLGRAAQQVPEDEKSRNTRLTQSKVLTILILPEQPLIATPASISS